MTNETEMELPIFRTYPGLMLQPPKLKQMGGKWVLEWTFRDKDTEVTLVLHAYVTMQPLWSYAIYDVTTNTVRQYLGRSADMEKDRLMMIEEGRPPT